VADDLETICMELIVHAGEARAYAYRAADLAAAGDFAGAASALAAADTEIAAAHGRHKAALALDGAGGLGPVSLLLAHAEDQMMTACSERGLIEYIVGLHRRLAEKDAG